MKNPTNRDDQTHRWAFARRGGVNQALLRNADDLRALDTLDPKLWMALSMPVAGTAVDPKTFALLDTDNDGHLRPPEILAAVRWILKMLSDAEIIFKPGDSIPLAAISDPNLLSSAKRILTDFGKPDATKIRLADVSDLSRIFNHARFNGDGIVPPDAASDSESEAKAIADILRVLPGTPDRNGEAGIDVATLNLFFDSAKSLCDWADRRDATPELEAAAEAVQKIRAKVDDYFARCRLAEFDPRATEALNRQASDYRVISDKLLSGTSAEIAALPLAAVAPGKPLPLKGALNPAWSESVADFTERAVRTLLGTERESLTEPEWEHIKNNVVPVSQWMEEKPQTPIEALGLPRLREMISGDCRARLSSLIEQDAAMQPEYARVATLEKLILFRRDLFEILTNTVNFTDFYGQTLAVFQAGVLLLDARACSLCVEVTNPSKHAMLAGLSGAFLVYCDLTRSGGQKKTIVAAITNGDSDNLMVGRNGIFYDRDGLDWNATVTKTVSNPISVREAFWLPYKKLVRMIEEQIAKRAQAADKESTAKLSDTAARVAAPDQAKPAEPRKFDLGAIALVGTAIGGISALVSGFLHILFGMGFWLPVGLLGILMLISGPSMLLASMKLRQRNLGPILDAGGWAINTRARINIPFGAELTRMARLPENAERVIGDPFADRRRVFKLLGGLTIAVLLFILWRMWLAGAFEPVSKLMF